MRLLLDNTDYTSAAEADYPTIAYEASTGARLWVVHYNGPGDANDIAYSLGMNDHPEFGGLELTVQDVTRSK